MSRTHRRRLRYSGRAAPSSMAAQDKFARIRLSLTLVQAGSIRKPVEGVVPPGKASLAQVFFMQGILSREVMSHFEHAYAVKFYTMGLFPKNLY